jgi:hypothetical protein
MIGASPREGNQTPKTKQTRFGLGWSNPLHGLKQPTKPLEPVNPDYSLDAPGGWDWRSASFGDGAKAQFSGRLR